jgi:hypothetical protein
MSDGTTKITTTLPNDVVDGLRQLAKEASDAHCGAPAPQSFFGLTGTVIRFL